MVSEEVVRATNELGEAAKNYANMSPVKDGPVAFNNAWNRLRDAGAALALAEGRVVFP